MNEIGSKTNIFKKKNINKHRIARKSINRGHFIKLKVTIKIYNNTKLFNKRICNFLFEFFGF